MVLHNRAHVDRVLCVPGSKEDGASRLQEQIPPEIVPTDAYDNDNMPRRGRKTQRGGI